MLSLGPWRESGKHPICLLSHNEASACGPGSFWLFRNDGSFNAISDNQGKKKDAMQTSLGCTRQCVPSSANGNRVQSRAKDPTGAGNNNMLFSPFNRTRLPQARDLPTLAWFYTFLCLAPHFSLISHFSCSTPPHPPHPHSSTTNPLTMSNKPSAKAVARLNATTLFPEIKKGTGLDELSFMSQLHS